MTPTEFAQTVNELLGSTFISDVKVTAWGFVFGWCECMETAVVYRWGNYYLYPGIERDFNPHQPTYAEMFLAPSVENLAAQIVVEMQKPAPKL